MPEILHDLSSGLRPRLYLRFPAPRAGFFLCSCKERNQRKHAPEPPTASCASRENRRSPNSPGAKYAPRAQTRGSLLPIFPAMLGGGYGDLKTPPRDDLSCVAPNPVGASRAPSEAGGLREPLDRARGALFSARRVRRAPGRSEAHREPRVFCAAKRPGVLLFGDFLLDKQEKVTQGAGAEPPAICRSTSPKAIRHYCLR